MENPVLKWAVFSAGWNPETQPSNCWKPFPLTLKISFVADICFPFNYWTVGWLLAVIIAKYLWMWPENKHFYYYSFSIASGQHIKLKNIIKNVGSGRDTFQQGETCTLHGEQLPQFWGEKNNSKNVVELMPNSLGLPSVPLYRAAVISPMTQRGICFFPC